MNFITLELCCCGIFLALCHQYENLRNKITTVFLFIWFWVTIWLCTVRHKYVIKYIYKKNTNYSFTTGQGSYFIIMSVSVLALVLYFVFIVQYGFVSEPTELWSASKDLHCSPNLRSLIMSQQPRGGVSVIRAWGQSALHLVN